MKELRGKVVADKIKAELKNRIEALEKNNINPTLAIVRVGENDSDISYERAILKVSASIGLHTKPIELPVSITTEELIAEI